MARGPARRMTSLRPPHVALRLGRGVRLGRLKETWGLWGCAVWVVASRRRLRRRRQSPYSMRKMLAAVSRVLSGVAQKPVRQHERLGVGREWDRGRTRRRRTGRASGAAGWRRALGLSFASAPRTLHLAPGGASSRPTGAAWGEGELGKARVEGSRGLQKRLLVCCRQKREPWASSSLQLTPFPVHWV